MVNNNDVFLALSQYLTSRSAACRVVEDRDLRVLRLAPAAVNHRDQSARPLVQGPRPGRALIQQGDHGARRCAGGVSVNQGDSTAVARAEEGIEPMDSRSEVWRPGPR